ncbi:MAG: WG repeat-containing protein [Clostridia bacterium]|nr:WG repeat-containing protein [Clostridia bacterium]
MRKIRRLFIWGILCLNICLISACSGKKEELRSTEPDLGLYPAALSAIGGVKWGYIDKSGKFVIKPQYTSAQGFGKNGLAVVSLNDWFGVIDTKGKYIVIPKYSYIDEYSEGFTNAVDQRKTVVLDEKGKTIFETNGYVGRFRDERAVYGDTGAHNKYLYGYIDKTGKIAVEPKYETAGDFDKGKAVVKFEEGGYGIIDKQGKVLHTFNYHYVGDLGDGLLAFKSEGEGKFGFIDTNGKVVIEPRFTGVQPFKDGRAVVNTAEDYFKGKYGLIDKKGNFVIRPEYSDILELGEGLYAVGIPIDTEYAPKGSKYAIANKDGKIVSDFLYYGVSEYNHGMASAFDNTKTFFIDKKGKKSDHLPAMEGSGTLKLLGSLVKADVDQRITYLGRDGKIIWRQNPEIPLGGSYSVWEKKYKPNRNYLVYYPEVKGVENKAVEASVNEKLRDMAVTENVNSNTELDYSYEGDFNIPFYKKDLLVLNITGYNYPFGAAHGMPTNIYAHLDLKTGTFYQLKDLFKENSDYVGRLSEIVKSQIEKQGENSDVWMDSYKGISQDQHFFITRDVLNLYFYPYQIAPYAAGFPTFSIPFGEIMDIIDVEGPFWRSFHD